MSKGFKLYLFIILAVMLYPLSYKYKGVHKDLIPYSNKLFKLTGIRVLSADFGAPFGRRAIAHCNIIYKTIVIDKTLWNSMSENNKLIILGHEALHCYKKARHNDNWGDGFCPNSIMYPSNMGRWCSDNYFDKYIKEIKEWK